MKRFPLLLLAAILVTPATSQTFPSARGSWLRIPGELSGDRRNARATLLLDGRVAVSGGATAVIDLFDPATDTISPGPSDVKVRKSHTATRLTDGRILFAGGEPFDGSCSIYDPVAGTVVPTGTMTVGRQKHSATLLPNGKVLVTGGGSPNAAPIVRLTSCEIFDPAAGTWSPAGALLAARAEHTAVLLPNGKVLIAGGYAPDWSIHYAELYDPATRTSANAFASYSTRYAAIPMADGRILCIELDGDRPVYAFYDPATGAISRSHVDGHTESPAVGLLPDGRLIFAGADHSLLHDLSSLHTTATDTTLVKRQYPAGVVLADGRFLIVGDSNIAEVFDAHGRGVARGDFNNDGRSDILWHHPATLRSTVWRMDGVSASAGGMRGPSYSSDTRWRLETILDVDGGGITDVVWRHIEQEWVAWPWDAGELIAFPGAGFREVQPLDWSIVATADFDADGREELVWRRTNGEIHIWSTSSVHANFPFRTFMADADFVIAAADDFDGDGYADVLWHHLVRGENYIWFMTKTESGSWYYVERAGHTAPVTDMNYSVAGTGDFDGDGKADIVWRSVFGPTRIWFMNGVTIANDVAVPAPGAGWNAAVIGDFDADGKSDVFWRNPATGENAVTLFDGYNVKASSSLPAVTEAGWVTFNP